MNYAAIVSVCELYNTVAEMCVITTKLFGEIFVALLNILNQFVLDRNWIVYAYIILNY